MDATPPAPQVPPPAESPPGVAATATIQYDDFAKLDLRVATVTECTPHAERRQTARA